MNPDTKFNLWFVCIAFPLLFMTFWNVSIAAVFTAILFGVMLGIRAFRVWLIIRKIPRQVS